MAGVNKVIVVGRLGNDPEVKNIGNSGTMTRISVATSENWVDKEGHKQERTEWHRIVVWGKLAEICGKHLSKGRQVYVEGRLQTRSWEDQQGQKRYATEIVASTVQFLGAAGGAERGEYDQSSGGSAGGSGGGSGGGGRGGYQNNNNSNNNSNDFGADFGPEPSFDSSEEIPF